MVSSLGWPVVTRSKKRTICCLFDQFWSNFRYFMDFSGTWTLVMATKHEGPSALFIFLGIFLGNGRFFRWVLQGTTCTRLNVQTVEPVSSVWCCWGTVLDLQVWRVTQSRVVIFQRNIHVWRHFVSNFLGGGHGGLRYCGIGFFSCGISLSLKFIWLLRVVFSSQQRLNRPAVNAVQWRHSLPENLVVILIGWLSKHSHNYV